MAQAASLEENGVREERPGDRARRSLEVKVGKSVSMQEKSVKRPGEHRGMLPATHRSGGEGGPIRFAVARTDLGWVLVAGTGRGLCAIDLGDSRERLIDALKARFDGAEHREGDPESVRWLCQVTESIESPRRGPDLRLDIRGTAFQRRVWQELRRIPVGRTASYGEVARRIGKSGSARAVARACASNRLALVVPCHRVVRSDGDPGGYRWGVERKRALLEREGGIMTHGCSNGSKIGLERRGAMDSIYKIIDVVGTSKTSWEQAAKNAVETAGKSLEDLRVGEVVKLDLVIDKNKVVAYRARVNISFKYRA
jgi:O-6-methylguanine DNA methyltransferase